MIGRATGSPLERANRDRAAAARRAADLEVSRSGRLVDGADAAEIDAIDADIAAEKRKVAIYDQQIAVLQTAQQRQAHDARERRREEAIKTLRGKFAKREAIAAEIEATIKQLGEKFAQLNDDRDLRSGWPWPLDLPNYFSFRCSSLSQEIARTLARTCRDMLPSAALAAIATSHAGDGVVRAQAPRGPEGVAATYSSHTALALELLAKVDIHSGTDNAEERAA